MAIALERFLARMESGDYADLVRCADDDPAWFWQGVLDFFGINCETAPGAIYDDSRGIEWVQWLPGARLNLAKACLESGSQLRGADAAAVLYESELGKPQKVTFGELSASAYALAAGLRRLGVGPGDRVGLMLPMSPEAVAAFFGIALVGAVIVPLFTGFGIEALRVRLQDAAVSTLIVASTTKRRGKSIPLKSVADEACEGLDCVERMIVVPDADGSASLQPGRDVLWEATLDTLGPAVAESVQAEHTLMIIYTSGTTGRPKGTVHSHGGFMLKVACDLGLMLDMNARDRVMWMGDIGWLTGPILITGTMLLGATFVLAEGTPDYPAKGRVWDLASRHGVSFLSLSPTLIRAQMRLGERPREGRDLSALRIVASTGEVWQEDAWRWCERNVCAGASRILNYTGGTEIGGSILSGNLLIPSVPCSVGRPVPAMGVAIADEPDPERAFEGELILTRHSPGLSRGLFRAPERYLASYWEKRPGVWSHGDLVARDADGNWFVRGRVDDVLKIAGKRISPVEIEMTVAGVPGVIENAVTGVPDPVSGEALAVFVTRGQSVVPEELLVDEVKLAVRRAFGAAFQPREVFVVESLPRTRSQKVMRGVLRKLLAKEVVTDTASMDNPDCLPHIRAVLAKAAGG